MASTLLRALCGTSFFLSSAQGARDVEVPRAVDGSHRAFGSRGHRPTTARANVRAHAREWPSAAPAHSHHIIGEQAQHDGTAGEVTALCEPPPAAARGAQPDSPDHERERRGGAAAAAGEEERAGARSGACGGEQRDLHGGEAGEHGLGVRGVAQGDALDAGAGVVAQVHVRVDHVVEDRPGGAAGVEEQGGRRRRRGEQRGHAAAAAGAGAERGRQQQRHAERGEADERAPGEGQPEHELRVVRDALGERVGGDEQQRGHGDGEARGRQLQQHREPRGELDGRVGERGARGEGAAGERPVARPRDERVQVSVPEVVDGAAGAAHDEGAGDEERRGTQDAGRGGRGQGERRGEQRAE